MASGMGEVASLTPDDPGLGGTIAAKTAVDAPGGQDAVATSGCDGRPV